MSLLDSFGVIFGAMVQVFLLGFCGYVLTKKHVISSESLTVLSRLLVGLLLPCFIFAKFIESFSFAGFGGWWVFPLLSIVVTVVGGVIGVVMVHCDQRLKKFQKEFVSLVAFQNSGYLPLILVSLLFSGFQQERMFICILLFLLGFNLVIWSAGVFYLTKTKKSTMQLSSLVSPPVLAVIISFAVIATGVNRFIPGAFTSTAKMLGNCVLPLAMIVVGGNLSLIAIGSKENAHSIIGVVVAKLLVMPMVCFGALLLLRPSYEVAFLLLLQSAVPSATSLSLITRSYHTQDNIISAGIFWTHVLSLVTIPVFLALFNLLAFYL